MPHGSRPLVPAGIQGALALWLSTVVSLQKLWRGHLSLPPAEGRAEGEAGPTWLSVGIDLQHEVGDQVEVEDTLVVGLLGGTGQDRQVRAVSTAQGHPEHQTPALGHPAQDLGPGACSGLHLEPALVTSAASFSAVQRIHSPFPDLCISAEQNLTSNKNSHEVFVDKTATCTWEFKSIRLQAAACVALRNLEQTIKAQIKSLPQQKQEKCPGGNGKPQVADDPGLGIMADTPDTCSATGRDLSRLEKWAGRLQSSWLNQKTSGDSGQPL